MHPTQWCSGALGGADRQSTSFGACPPIKPIHDQSVQMAKTKLAAFLPLFAGKPMQIYLHLRIYRYRYIYRYELEIEIQDTDTWMEMGMAWAAIVQFKWQPVGCDAQLKRATNQYPKIKGSMFALLSRSYTWNTN